MRVHLVAIASMAGGEHEDPDLTSAALRRDMVVIRQAVAQFGSALDCFDRGYTEHSRKMEADADDTIRIAFNLAPGLRQRIPWLWEKMNRGKSAANDGFEINDALAALEQEFAARPTASPDTD